MQTIQTYSDKFKKFHSDVSTISLPNKFTFPFYYEPNELCIIAAAEVQNYLKIQTDFTY